MWDPLQVDDLDRYEIYRAPNLPIIGIVNRLPGGFLDTFVIEGSYGSWFDNEGELRVDGSTGNDAPIDNPTPPPEYTKNPYTIVKVIETGSTTEISVVVTSNLNSIPDGYIGTLFLRQLAGKTTSSTNFVDKELPEGFYYYMVAGITKNGDYNVSDIVIKSSPEYSTPPDQITNLRTEVSFNHDSVELTWNESMDQHLKGYAIYRSIIANGIAMRASLLEIAGTFNRITIYGHYDKFLDIGDTLTWKDPPSGPNHNAQRAITSITETDDFTTIIELAGPLLPAPNDTSGYVSWEYTKWELLDTTTSPKFTDTKIPKGIDWFSRMTYTQYMIFAYDTSFNMSLPVFTDIIEISPINKRATVDYLDINLYWDTVKEEDHIQGVIALIKGKNSTYYEPVVSCKYDEVMSILSTRYNIEKGKSYDIKFATRHYFDTSYVTFTNQTIKITPIYQADYDDFQVGYMLYLFDCTDPLDNGRYEIRTRNFYYGNEAWMKVRPMPQYSFTQYNTNIGGTDYGVIHLYGNWSEYYNPGETITIENILFNSTKGILYSENLLDETIIYLSTAFQPAEIGDVTGYTYSKRPKNATAGGNVIPLSAYIEQPPNIPINIPDYIEDTVRPTAPTNVVITKDPDNDRIYVTWDRNKIDDDFLRYEIQMYEPKDPNRLHHIHGRTTDNNYTINGITDRMDNDVYKIVGFHSTLTEVGFSVDNLDAIMNWSVGDLVEVRGCKSITGSTSVQNNTTYQIIKIYTDGGYTYVDVDLPVSAGTETIGFAARPKRLEIGVTAIDRAGNRSDTSWATDEWRSYEHFGKLDYLGYSVFKTHEAPWAAKVIPPFIPRYSTQNYWLPQTIWWMWTNKWQYGKRSATTQSLFPWDTNPTPIPPTTTDSEMMQGRHGPYMDNTNLPPTTHSIAAELRLRLTDMARDAKFFKNYIILGAYDDEGHAGTTTPFNSIKREFGVAQIDPEEILEIANTNEITINLELSVRGAGKSLYIWAWVMDKFGNKFPALDSKVVEVRLPDDTEWS